MSDATVRGVVHWIDETKSYGQKGFRKRRVVLEQDDGRFTNYIPVDFVQDACDLVDDLTVGSDVEVSIRLRGRKWQRDPSSEVKYFLDAEAGSFKVLGAAESHRPSPASASSDVSAANEQLADSAEDGEIPF